MNRTPSAVIAICAASFLFGSACKEEEAEQFGFTCLELHQAESEEENPFSGTAKIQVTLLYDQCLIDFYTKKHSEYRQDGADGPAVFEEWAGRLCSESVSDPLVPCEIDSITQTLIPSGNSSVYQMEVIYKVTDASAIAGRTLLWGPGPLTDFAECEMGSRPYAKLTAQSGIRGIDKDGNTLWQAQSWGDGLALVQLSTAGCIQVDVARL